MNLTNVSYTDPSSSMGYEEFVSNLSLSNYPSITPYPYDVTEKKILIRTEENCFTRMLYHF